jgi:hypothetical protein
VDPRRTLVNTFFNKKEQYSRAKTHGEVIVLCRDILEDVNASSWACGAVGSALPWHGRGREFESLQVHHAAARQCI